MENQIETTATTMNKIRFAYIDCYNALVDELTKKYNKENSKTLIHPVMTKRVKDHLKNKIAEMQCAGVQEITDILTAYINSMNSEASSSSPNSKTRRFSKDISSLLEQSFCYNMYPTEDEKLALAQRCRISLKQVSNWFTNKRNRTKTIRGRRSY